MDQSAEYRNKLEFFGRITASISHELNNVFSIVNELNGVVEDMIEIAGPGNAVDPHRLESVNGRISAQLSRGNSIIKKMNRFAHTIDEPLCHFDAAGVIDNFVSIYRRLADLRHIRINFADDGGFKIFGSPFGLQFVIYRCLEVLINHLPENSTIRISFTPDNEISISAEGVTVRPEDEIIAELKHAAASVGFEAVFNQNETNSEFIVHIINN
ncbi:MAG: hypothetical protein ACLFQX_13835 [Candidatus Kapaibacterium sp.]